MHLFIPNYPLKYAKRWRRCAVWIINWALEIHCNPKVSLGANKLVSEDSTKRNHRGWQRIYAIWYSFCILGENFARPFELKQILSLNPVPPKIKIICFWFQKVKNDWLWIKVFERFITILNISVGIIWDLFFQLVLIFEKLDSKVELFSTEQLKILSNTLIRPAHLFFLNYPLQYAERLVTLLQSK